jgi:hypothetical protein
MKVPAMKRKARYASHTPHAAKRIWEAREPELRRIFEGQLRALNDTGAAKTLTAMGVPALAGGTRWQAIQVQRVRARLRVNWDRLKEQRFERMHKDVKANLTAHFGRQPPPRSADGRLLDYVTMLTVAVSRFDLAITMLRSQRRLTELDASDARAFERCRTQLRHGIECLRAASDVFERKVPASMPRSRAISAASLALQRAEDPEIASIIEAALRLRVATDTASVDKDAGSAPTSNEAASTGAKPASSK